MAATSPRKTVLDSGRSERFHLWRSRKDLAVRWIIAVGGVGVILAVVLIFFYLLWVVFPLFLPATSHLKEGPAMSSWKGSETLYLAIEEQLEVGLRVSDSGRAEFFHVADGKVVGESRLPGASAARLILSSEAVEKPGYVAYAASDGRVFTFRHHYETRFSGGVETRQIVPVAEHPYGEQALLTMPSPDIAAMAYSEGDTGLVLAAAGSDGLVRVNFAVKSENFLTGELTLEAAVSDLTVPFEVTSLAISSGHKWLFLGDRLGRIHSYTLPGLQLAETIETNGSPVTRLAMLLGGISVLAGHEDGSIGQLFPVRGAGNRFHLQMIRDFESMPAAVSLIRPEERRKGFLVLDEENNLAFFHSTAGRLVMEESLSGLSPRSVALAPRANGLLVHGAGDRLSLLEIENEHPEVSFASLWRKVWYENYEEPDYIWQSSAATNEFEPKFSLTPLVFGTIKAAFYAMLFAIPLALMGAAYTAYFMSAQLRKWVKPGIEIMAALPTVILGFLAGLWFAPWVEEHLADLFLMALFIPPGLLAFAWAWSRLDLSNRLGIPEGWESMLLIPAILTMGALAIATAEPIQMFLFGGEMRDWLTNEVGISYDQRNALVVGCAMGFAVIPTIFSIAEDAVFGVPETLSNGSLALGATPWQTLVFVVLPTASPGIFSALMIGLGRAVGETMIVLMATGNTPVMDWNLFEGMRTLAANIAVEMPESEVNSTHYRILFLAALVLFMFTFVVNTGAELIRQRLREKYSSL